SRIRGANTKPELLLRRALHCQGFRYRLHSRDLPGRPDLVFPRYHAVIFVHGCFWHGHECPMCKVPATRPEFWATKIDANRARDRSAVKRLREGGWRVLMVWECALRGPARLPKGEVLEECGAFLASEAPCRELVGSWQPVQATSDGAT